MIYILIAIVIGLVFGLAFGTDKPEKKEWKPKKRQHHKTDDDFWEYVGL